MEYSPAELNNEAKEMYIQFLTDIAMIFDAELHRARSDSEEVLDLFLELAKVGADYISQPVILHPVT